MHLTSGKRLGDNSHVDIGAPAMVARNCLAFGTDQLQPAGDVMEDVAERAVLRAIDAMRERLGEPLTVDDLARAAMFSKFHFTRLFQRLTGVSPGRFLSALRLQKAKQ